MWKENRARDAKPAVILDIVAYVLLGRIFILVSNGKNIPINFFYKNKMIYYVCK